MSCPICALNSSLFLFSEKAWRNSCKVKGGVQCAVQVVPTFAFYFRRKNKLRVPYARSN